MGGHWGTEKNVVFIDEGGGAMEGEKGGIGDWGSIVPGHQIQGEKGRRRKRNLVAEPSYKGEFGRKGGF